MKPKHTQGPWKIDTSFGELEVVSDAYGVAKIVSNCGKETANARLIAAAPEMLEALEFLFANISTDEMQRLEDRRDANFVRLEALIAKARGVK